MSDTTKINGYVYTDDAIPSFVRNGALTFHRQLEHFVEQPATLVIGEDAMPMSKVVKMLREAYYINPETTETYLGDIATKYGINL